MTTGMNATEKCTLYNSSGLCMSSMIIEFGWRIGIRPTWPDGRMFPQCLCIWVHQGAHYDDDVMIVC
jgi:hypothetical protein